MLRGEFQFVLFLTASVVEVETEGRRVSEGIERKKVICRYYTHMHELVIYQTNINSTSWMLQCITKQQRLKRIERKKVHSP